MNATTNPELCMLNTTQYEALHIIGYQALREVEFQYGTGFPTYQIGEDGDLSGHNRHHAMFVRAGSEAMGIALGMSATERALSRVSATAHDIVQLKARGQMERESADWLTRRLRRSGFFGEDYIKITELAVLGTEPLFANGTLTHMASCQEYPSKAAERIALSVASADIGEAYSATGPIIAHDLFREKTGFNRPKEPPFDQLLEYQRNQLTFLDRYRFPHPFGERVFGTLRKAVISYSVNLTLRLERGDIENMSQVVAADLAFMRQHG